MKDESEFTRLLSRLIRLLWVFIISVFASSGFFVLNSLGIIRLNPLSSQGSFMLPRQAFAAKQSAEVWHAPDSTDIIEDSNMDLIQYGRELIMHTSLYLGPQGKVRKISNGMNCQNCHLKAGTVPFGNNYGKVASTYPKLRHRSGTIEGFEKRVNDCIERSLNGEKLEVDSREMKAIVAYLKWVGKDVKKGKTPVGLGLLELNPIDRAADTVIGERVYERYCARCHGADGQGQLAEDGVEWKYPPLYGNNSYNIGAGLFRISTFASFVKNNMPYGITFENAFLTDDEAWDVAAYVNSKPRPTIDLSGDWPDKSKKPYDYPFGPYADSFSEEQHKYGPFAMIKDQ